MAHPVELAEGASLEDGVVMVKSILPDVPANKRQPQISEGKQYRIESDPPAKSPYTHGFDDEYHMGPWDLDE